MPLPSSGLFPSPDLLPGIDVLPAAPTPFTDQVQASLAPLADPGGDWVAYNKTLGSMFEQVFSIVSDQGDPDDPANYTPGWSILLDPVNCPTEFLPFQGQFVGVPIQPGTDDATARSLIKQEQGFQRGTPAAIVAAAQRFLTGSQSCVLLERTPNPYGFTLVVRPEQLTSLSGLTAAVSAVKPAGVTFSVVQTDGWTLFQMEAAYATLTALEAAFVTVGGLENDQVGA